MNGVLLLLLSAIFTKNLRENFTFIITWLNERNTLESVLMTKTYVNRKRNGNLSGRVSVSRFSNPTRVTGEYTRHIVLNRVSS